MLRPKMSSSMGAMGTLPGKLRSLLVSSNNQLPDPLKDEIMLLIQDLEGACTFLVDLSRAEAPHTMVKLWRSEVCEMSYDLEDYIDKATHPYSNQFEVEEFGILVELTRDACKSYHRYQLGRLWPSSNPSFMAGLRGRVPMLDREEAFVVGINDARHKLISLLRDNKEQDRKVVAIHGPAGVGKTTLAQEVYREIGGEFESRAFVRASRMPDTRRLLLSIISQIQRHQRPSDDYGTVQGLIESLKKNLQTKRYFIIIDGLWETMSWDIINTAFPGGTYSSRILIITDIEEIALECSDYQSDAILVEPLSRDYSVELLNNKLSCHKHDLFEQVKGNLDDIIRTCSGLPLATIGIANILASQPDNLQLWCQVKACLSSRLRNNLNSEGVLREIVGLSYDCLSHDLKVCLLYLSMYPEGCAFLKADLLKQWAAEGFTSASQENANEVAESYFDELVCRGLIQPNHVNFADTVVSYTMHSTMFEVIKSKSIEENFSTVIDYSNTMPELSSKVRRLSLRYSNAKYATKPVGITLSPVRSLMFYGLIECLPSVTEFEVLRVLNLEFWGDQEELDLSVINQLFQLRYLWITTDIVVKLPTEMKGLKYLETLEIYGRVTSVPPDIVLLPSLLHLCLHGEIIFSDGISLMRSLRTLQSFDLSSNSEDTVRRLGEMTDLHDLHLTCSKAMSDALERNLIALASSLGKLGKLTTFIIAPDTSCSSIYLDCSSIISTASVFLQRFELLPPICIFSRLPKWIGQLRRLCILKIVVRQLSKDDIDSIAGLQELHVISLFIRQPSAERVVFNRAAFPVLRYFRFRCGLLRLSFQVETMPSLRSLKLEFNVHSGDQYNDMLTGIENLLNIQEVAGRIGAVPGAEESTRMCAESALKDAIIKHSQPPAVNIRRVDWFDEEISQFSELPTGTCSLDMAIGASPKALAANLLKKITNDFSPERLLGHSVFGTIYMGALPEGGMIAVNRLAAVNSTMAQGKTFESEVTNLMAIQHENILKLVGFCHEAEKKVIQLCGRYEIVDLTESCLCYNYLPKGSLDKYLYAESAPDWNIRFKIIMGICQGLHFLHKNSDGPFVHMNLVPNSIWLDDNWVPKIANFGLSGIFGQEQTRKNTINDLGQNGYMAPEYLHRGEISTMSDIYSLGMLIIEITTVEKNCASEADRSARKYVDKVHRNWNTDGQIISKYPSLDPNDLRQVKACIAIGLKCVEADQNKRPSIEDIINKLNGQHAAIFDELEFPSTSASGGHNVVAAAQHFETSLATSKNAANDMNRINDSHLFPSSDTSSLDFDGADQLIQLWDAIPEAFVFEAPEDDIARYLAAVDVAVDHVVGGCARSVQAGVTVQMAMVRLEKEFRHHMLRHAFSGHPTALFLSLRNSEPLLECEPSSSLEYCEDADASSADFDAAKVHSLDATTSDDLVFDRMRAEAVKELRAIADRMARAGYARELADAYSGVRRYLLYEYLSELGVEHLSIHKVKLMDWKHLMDKLDKWVPWVKTLVPALLAHERRLCGQVLAASDEIRDECFLESTKGCIMRILNFGDAVTMYPRSPEKLFRILDMYEALAGLIPEMKALCLGSSWDGVIRDVQDILDRLGDAVRGILIEFENIVRQDKSRRAMTSGDIHPMTRYVMNYLKLLVIYSETLDVLFNNDNNNDQNACEDQDKEHLESMTHFGRRLLMLISYLEAKLEEYSGLYDDAALGCIFAMNNFIYIDQKVKDSELGKILSVHWIKMRMGKVRQYSNMYLTMSWNKVLSYLHESESVRGSGNRSDSGHLISTKIIKSKFNGFNNAFDEIYRNQTRWKVPDPQLREELRTKISETVIPAYHAFFARYASQVDAGRNQGTYKKYTPEKLEDKLSDLFEG